MPRPTQEAIERAYNVLQQTLPSIEGVESTALFGLSPAVSKAEFPDLDVVIVTGESANQEQLNQALQQAATESGLPVDAWVLGVGDLLARMQRIAAKYPQPEPTSSLEGWNGPAFISVLGQNVLETIIHQANASPIHEAPIPPDPASKRMYNP